MQTITKSAEWVNSRGTKQGYEITLTVGRHQYHDDVAGTIDGAPYASLNGIVWAGSKSTSYLANGFDPCDSIPGASGKLGPMAVRSEIAAKFVSDYAELQANPEYVAIRSAQDAGYSAAAQHDLEEQRIDNIMTLNGHSF